MEILGNEQRKDFMKLTIEFENTEELDKILTLLQQNNISGVNIMQKNKQIIKGDKSIDPNSLFGIWKDNPKTLEEIRNK